MATYYFRQVKNWWSGLWRSQKLPLGDIKTPFRRRNWMSEQLSGLLILATSIPPCLVRPVKVSTSSERYPDYFWLPTFLDCSGIQFFDSSPYANTATPLPVPHLCDLGDTIPFYWSPGEPRGAEDFPGGGKHPRHVPRLTFLVWLQRIIHTSTLIFNHVKTKDALLVVKSLTKKPCSHINQQPFSPVT